MTFQPASASIDSFNYQCLIIVIGKPISAKSPSIYKIEYLFFFILFKVAFLLHEKIET